MATGAAPSSNPLRQLALVVLVVELRLHAVDYALAREGLDVLPGDERVLHPVGDGGAAFGDVHGGVVGMDLAGGAGLATRIVRAEPGGEPQRLAGCAEMLVVPARATRRRRDEANRLVVDPLDEVRLAIAPRRNAGMFRPRVGVPLALYADEHGRGGVGVGFGIAAVLVLADPQIERIAGHERLDAAPARRAAVVERQVAVDDIRYEVGAPHGEPPHRVRL